MNKPINAKNLNFVFVSYFLVLNFGAVAQDLSPWAARGLFASTLGVWESYQMSELDGVGPVDNRPSTDQIHKFEEKKEKKYIIIVTCDMLHVTCDMRHMTRDM